MYYLTEYAWGTPKGLTNYCRTCPSFRHYLATLLHTFSDRVTLEPSLVTVHNAISVVGDELASGHLMPAWRSNSKTREKACSIFSEFGSHKAFGITISPTPSMNG